MHVSKNWVAKTGLVLVPSGGYLEEVAGGSVSSPKLQELKDLALALDEEEGSEASAGKMAGSKDYSLVSVAIVSAFGDEGADGAGLYGVESCFGEVTVRKDVSNGCEINGIIEGS